MKQREMHEKMEKALGTIRKVLESAHKEVRDELLKKKGVREDSNGKKIKFISGKKPANFNIDAEEFNGCSDVYYVWGRPATRNRMTTSDCPEKKRHTGRDLRNYVWVTVENAKSNEKCYINLFYNDLDPNTGNPHTQFGRIQFARGGSKDDLNLGKPSEKTEASIHDRISMKQVPKGADYDGYGIHYYHGEKSRDSDQAIFMGTFDPEKLVKDFIEFLEETQQKEIEYVKDVKIVDNAKDVEGLNWENNGDGRWVVIELGKKTLGL